MKTSAMSVVGFVRSEYISGSRGAFVAVDVPLLSVRLDELGGSWCVVVQVQGQRSCVIHNYFKCRLKCVIMLFLWLFLSGSTC